MIEDLRLVVYAHFRKKLRAPVNMLQQNEVIPHE